jgi:AraC family transcriptional regulator of adaptative response/methylated-DNA-[protein]-cysteine methyltransferase
MSERIRFAWGSSFLGEFLAAASEEGAVVSLDLGEHRDRMLNTLHSRFPDDDIVPDQPGLAGLVGDLAGAIDEPGLGTPGKLDARGSEFQRKVWAMLLEIPAGETTNYGSLAAKLGTRDARDVTEAIASNTIAVLIPCHRVVKKNGSISGYRWGVRRKRMLLGTREAAKGDRP